MTKKVLSVLMAIAIIICMFSGCKSKASNESHELVVQEAEEIVEDTESFKLGYSQSDSLNPYESDSQNNFIVGDLVFEPLFRLDESFDVKPEIASSYSYDDSKTLRVTIVSGLKFSDGTSLNSSDVVSAFNSAKDSYYWGNSLDCISSAYTDGDTSVVFNLKYANKYAHQLLTFYIVKAEQGDSNYPIGSGRYKFNDGDGKVFLELNTEYKEEFNPRFTKINLVNVPATDSINNALNIGNITFAYRDLSTQDITRLESDKKRVAINNIVYIGLNSDRTITSNSYVRKAISLAIDRSTIVKSAYQGCGEEATSVFNPVSKLGKETTIFDSSSDIAAAKQALASSGYTSPSISILVSDNTDRASAAQLIKQELEEVGFSVTVNEKSSDDFLTALDNGNYDIYLAETKLPNDMRLTTFFSSDGNNRYGIDQDCNSATEYNSYLDGDSDIGKFTLEFSNELPFIPVLYRDAMICYSKAMHGDMQGYYGNFFSNIEDWYFN